MRTGNGPAGRHSTLLPRPIAAAIAMLAAHAGAAEIDVGNPDVAMRWDTTVKYSAAWRVRRQDPALLVNANSDDGDRNFDRGLVSSRLDLFSELDLTWQKRLGARFSGAGNYDAVYNTRNDNPGFPGGAFPNQTSVRADEFTAATRKVHGRHAEVLDAFVFGKAELGDTMLSARAGRHALVWGESLFFGGNAIAGGQMPVDVVKLLSVPGTQFKEAIRPVPMLSAQWQLNSTVTLGAYVQTQWQASRLPAVGSFLSDSDVAVEGAERILTGPASAALRTGDLRAKNRGQGGLQLRYRGEETDYGVYLIRYHAKAPQLVPVLGLVPGVGPVPTSYYLAYHQNIDAIGASASRTFGDFNVAIEGSLRNNADLASSLSVDASALAPPGIVPATDNADNPAYAIGRTAHVNLSTLAQLPATPLWREASLVAEIAWNRVLKVTRNAAAADPNTTRDGAAVRVLLTPMYRAVVGGVDLGVPIGLGWAPRGSRPLAINNPNGWIPNGGGDFSLGLDGSFRDVWRFTLNYTHYFGDAAPFQVSDANVAFTWMQTRKDRDFVAASLRYSF
jgi:hypothetical protein